MEPEPYSFFGGHRQADKVTLITLLVLVFLTPLFFVPSSNVVLDAAKLILLYIGVTVAFLSWIIGRLQEGKVGLPFHYFFISLGLIPLSFLISAIFSGYRSLSFFGHGTEIQTFAFMLAAAVLVFITAIALASRRSITYFYFALLATFPLVVIFQIIRLVDPSQTLFGVFSSTTLSLLGNWNDLGIYCGLMALFAFLTLELLTVERSMKTILIAVIVVAFFFLSIVNFTLIWYVLGITALLFFIYNFVVRRSQSEKTGRGIPLTSLIIALVSFIFIIIPGNVYNILSSAPLNIHIFSPLSVNSLEIRPSWSSTFAVVSHVPVGRILVGPGPSRFVNDWDLSKPLGINQTVFWSTDFTVGVSTVATAVVETGLIGLLSWLAFLGLFLYIGIQGVFRKTDPVRRYLLISSFLTSSYLWIFSLLYTPSASVTILTFLVTGVFLAVLIESDFIKIREFSFVANPKTSFLAVLAFLVLVFGSLAFGYVSIKRFAAELSFNQAGAASGQGNPSEATNLLDRAISLNPASDYYAALSALNISELNTVVANLPSQNTSPSVAVQNEARNDLSTALSSAETAVSTDPTDYQNWLTLGQVYEVLLQLGETNAYPLAENAYNQAESLAPTDPAIPLVLARLNVENKDDADAKNDIAKALTLKSNYTDAVFLLSQIQAGEGDLKSAIQSVQALASISPNDPTVYFQLGLLNYDNKDYGDAIAAFSQAVSLESDYANAKYFLGLSDYYNGEPQAAIAQFEDLASTNPDNASVKTILANLEAGKDPFTNVPPPQNNPATLSQPPLSDQATSTADVKNTAVTQH